MTNVNVTVSEKIRDHLLQQRGRSVASRGQEPGGVSFCAYRGNGGRMCAVGCLIPDDEYLSEMEGTAAHHPRMMAILEPLYPGLDKSLLVHWQDYHDDKSQYQDWLDGRSGYGPEQAHQAMLARLARSGVIEE